jgi:subtilisin family serine protease
VRDLSVLSNQSVNQGINCFFEEGEYNPEDIPTLRYNMGTVFEGNERLAEEILEQGKNPGLGIRKLHEQGLTGKGINIGIIDSSLILKHPEYEGKIADYYDINIENAEIGPMHGAAITSILVGSEIGIIPDAKVYYVATETGMKADSQDVADGINWIMEQNKSLPDHQKIRIISISDDPAEMGCINREAYIKARDAATSEVC